MNRLTSLILTIPLLLAGCSDATTTTDLTPSDSSTETTTETTTARAEPSLAEIGDPIPVTCYWDDCIGEVTITDITVGEECRYGVSDYGEGYNDDTEGREILQLWGEFSLTKGRVGNNGEELNASVEDPSSVIDAEGFIQTPQSYQCKSADDGHEYWDKPLDPGQKTRIYGAFSVPAGSTAIIVEDYTLTLPGREIPQDALANLPSKEETIPAASGESPIEDLVLVESWGTLGIYFDNEENNYRMCDSRGYVTFDIMGPDGCTEGMTYEEIGVAAAESFERDLQRELGTEAPQ